MYYLRKRVLSRSHNAVRDTMLDSVDYDEYNEQSDEQCLVAEDSNNSLMRGLQRMHRIPYVDFICSTPVFRSKKTLYWNATYQNGEYYALRLHSNDQHAIKPFCEMILEYHTKFHHLENVQNIFAIAYTSLDTMSVLFTALPTLASYIVDNPEYTWESHYHQIAIQILKSVQYLHKNGITNCIINTLTVLMEAGIPKLSFIAIHNSYSPLPRYVL